MGYEECRLSAFAEGKSILSLNTMPIPANQGLFPYLGVVVAAPLDWTYPQLLAVFSCAAIVLGVTTSALGEWVEKVGPRMAGMIGSACWSSALLTTAVGIEAHNLPLVYLGYGVLGGVGWGLMYLTPVTSAMKWFPDRRG